MSNQFAEQDKQLNAQLQYLERKIYEERRTRTPYIERESYGRGVTPLEQFRIDIIEGDSL